MDPPPAIIHVHLRRPTINQNVVPVLDGLPLLNEEIDILRL